MVTRKYLWSLKAIGATGDWLIPETMGASVCSLSNHTAFEGLKVAIRCTQEQMDMWSRIIGGTKQLHLTRYNEQGVVLERWCLTQLNIYDINVESTDSIYGHFLRFKVRGKFSWLS
jgi:hypothetical protein